MASLTIPIGGDLAPFLAVIADLKSEMGRVGKTVKSSTNGIAKSAKDSASGFKVLKSEGNSAFASLAKSGRSAAQSIKSAFSSVKNILPMGALLGGAGVGVGIGASIAKAISQAANMEQMETSFIPLLKSADAAKARIADLSKFAAETPFEMPEIAKASRVLETLTRGALSTGSGLRLVGDIASATNQPFDEIAVTVGRLYDGLQSGRPVGEAMARLQELGVISGDARGKLEAMQKSQVNGNLVWNEAEKSLSKFSGSMALQSATWTGKLSTLKDNAMQALAAFGEPIIDAIKPFLDSSIDMAGKMTSQAAAFGRAVADVIVMVREAFASGQLGNMIGNTLNVAFGESVNFLWAALRGAISAVGQLIVEYFSTAVSVFKILITPSFWQGMGAAITGVFLDAVGFLQRGIAEALELARPLADLFGKGDSITKAQNGLRGGADVLRGEASAKYAQAGEALDPHLATIKERLHEAGRSIGDRFMKAFNDTEAVFDTSEAKAALQDFFGKLRAATQVAPGATGQPALAPAASSLLKTAPAQQGQFSTLTTSLGRIGGGGFGMSLGSNPMVQGISNMNKTLKNIERNTGKKSAAGSTEAIV